MVIRKQSSLVTIIFSCMLFIFSSHALALDKYTFEPDHTYIEWRVTHFGFSDISGKFMAEGSLEFDKAKPQNSKINVAIPIAGVTTGIAKLDKKLVSKNYFDDKQFATANFVSNRIQMTGKNTAKVYGVLTIRGIRKPLELNIKLRKAGDSVMYRKQTMGFSGTAELKRSDFGLRAYLPGVGDNVTLHIEAEAVLNYTPKKR